jgi:hypothetical protein
MYVYVHEQVIFFFVYNLPIDWLLAGSCLIYWIASPRVLGFVTSFYALAEVRRFYEMHSIIWF